MDGKLPSPPIFFRLSYCDTTYFSYFICRSSNIVTIVLSVIVLCINLFFAGVYLSELKNQHWSLYLLFAVVILLYLLFVFYLVSIKCNYLHSADLMKIIITN